jgi:hypothetical protein
MRQTAKLRVCRSNNCRLIFIVPVSGDVPLDAFDDDVVEDWEPEEGSPLGSFDDVRLVEPVSMASVGQWLSRWVRRREIA